MLEIDEIVALLKLDGLVLHLAYLVYSGKHTAYIKPYNVTPTNYLSYYRGTGNTEKEAVNNAWRWYVDYVDRRRNQSATQA